MADTAPVAPALLRYVDEYVEERTMNEVLRAETIDDDSALLVFYRELFAQLFANVLKEPLTGVGQRAGERARELYTASARDWSPPLRELVRDFQHFVKIYPDLLGNAYGDGNEAINDLHWDLLPSLLAHVQAWATNEALHDLASAAAASAERYRDFLDAFEPDWQ